MNVAVQVLSIVNFPSLGPKRGWLRRLDQQTKINKIHLFL